MTSSLKFSHECPDLRVLLLSTPKTGNTWLRNLLSVAYRLPQLTLTDWPFNSPVLDRENAPWITHHHYLPSPEIVKWIRINRIVLITTIRHPADVLISMLHHIHRFRLTSIHSNQLRSMLLEDFERTDIIPERVGEPFSYDLACSLEWIKTGLAHVVRYEELRCDPARVLTDLTSKIQPVEPARIQAAIDACDLQLMRRLAGPFGGFFRQGSVGGWRDILTPDLIRLLRDSEPYRSQLSALGYSMDDAPMCEGPRSQLNPIHQIQFFDNGVPLSPVLVKCFHHAPDELRARWSQEPQSTGPGSFFHWLNAPAPIPAHGPEADLPISNLAHFLYFDRHDVRRAFPDLQNRSKRAFVEWFQRYSESEYGLDRVFIPPRPWTQSPST